MSVQRLTVCWGGKGIGIPESHRKWLELEKDYRLQAFVNASPEELHSQDLLHFQALRRSQDLRAQALRTGQDLGDVHLQQGPPRKMSNLSNVTDSDEFENSNEFRRKRRHTQKYHCRNILNNHKTNTPK